MLKLFGSFPQIRRLIQLICCFSVFRKDARLPVQLQRAMAKEAEAARDARAKVFFVVVNKHFLILSVKMDL